MVISDGQVRVMKALEEKTEKAIRLYKNLTESVNAEFVHNKKEYKQEITQPKFL